MSAGLGHRQTNAAFRLYTTQAAPKSLPLSVTMLERHSFSSQSFLPMDAERYLVCVAANNSEAGRI
jgi:ureidoglycolate hydrolase